VERSTHRNLAARSRLVLAALLGGQLLLLAWQVRSPGAGGVRLVRTWSVGAMLPLERASRALVGGVGGVFDRYVALRGAQQRAQALDAEVRRLELQNTELREQARELPQLEALLHFQAGVQWRTQAAAVLSTGASADAQTLVLDRGANAGFRRNMAVIAPGGVVGKLTEVLSRSAVVLPVTDPESGVGALIGPSAVNGILRGIGPGRAELRDILKGEPVSAGMSVITSGEDQVFPKGLPIGTVTAVRPSRDGVFKTAAVRLAADPGRLEQVLVITATVPVPAQEPAAGATAAAIRQQQLPGLPAPAAGLPQPAKPPAAQSSSGKHGGRLH
jgi:rod shape-determining protein MreC